MDGGNAAENPALWVFGLGYSVAPRRESVVGTWLGYLELTEIFQDEIMLLLLLWQLRTRPSPNQGSVAAESRTIN